jgi:hypothetical protein
MAFFVPLTRASGLSSESVYRAIRSDQAQPETSLSEARSVSSNSQETLAICKPFEARSDILPELRRGE